MVCAQSVISVFSLTANRFGTVHSPFPRHHWPPSPA